MKYLEQPVGFIDMALRAERIAAQNEIGASREATIVLHARHGHKTRWTGQQTRGWRRRQASQLR